jgi:hypothetical protein
MKIKNGKYEGYEFFYRMEYQVNDNNDNYYTHSKDFVEENLGEARAKAFKYFDERVAWASSKQTLFNEELKIQPPIEFKFEQEVQFLPEISFMSRKDGNEMLNRIIDGHEDVESYEIWDSREHEGSVFIALGFEAPTW